MGVARQREMDPLLLLHDIDLEQPSTYLSIILTSVPVITVTLNGFSEIVRGIVEPRLDKIVKRDQTSQQRARFTYRCWKLLEVVLLTLLGFCVLRDEPPTPPSLGGRGNLERLFDYESPTSHPVSPTLAAYHLVRMGYLMEGWIFMDRFDYHYLTMHHVATAALLLMSHYVNTLEYGSLIILVHDAPNIATQLLVLLTALQEGPLGVLPLVVAYISSIVFWTYFMLWVFPYQILYLPHRTTRHYDLPVWQWHWFFGALL